MPELPDVMGFQKYTESTSLHQTVADAHVTDTRILNGVSARALKQRLKGQSLADTARRGKYLFVSADQGWLVLHFGMTGSLQYYKDGEEAPEYTRVQLDFDNGHHLAYQSKRMLGEVGWTESLDEFSDEHDLGPDAFEASADRALFHDRLEDKRGKLKSKLMDQSILSGIGNVYADEILFQAGLHPEAKLESVDEDTMEDLRQTMRRVLRVCGRHGGQVEEFPSHYLLPHRDENGSCPQCGRGLQWTRVNSRSTCFCSHCQSR
jgi:formamidopyrimidine-DNA glycosylase